MGYKELEIDTIGYKGKLVPMTFNISNIAYYRPWTETSEEMGEHPKLVTMVYFLGSLKATHVNCSYEIFKKKIDGLKEL